MADKESEIAESATKDTDKSVDSLESYVTEQYKHQKNEGKMEATDEIDDERTTAFFSRALSESRRMNCEVDKAHKKLEALHNELGTDNVMAWQREHAAEVLTPAQREHMGLMEKS